MIDNEYLEFIQPPYEVLLESCKRLERLSKKLSDDDVEFKEALKIRIEEFENVLSVLEEG